MIAIFKKFFYNLIEAVFLVWREYEIHYARITYTKHILNKIKKSKPPCKIFRTKKPRTFQTRQFPKWKNKYKISYSLFYNNRDSKIYRKKGQKQCSSFGESEIEDSITNNHQCDTASQEEATKAINNYPL